MFASGVVVTPAVFLVGDALERWWSAANVVVVAAVVLTW